MDDIGFIQTPHLKAAKEHENKIDVQKGAEKPDSPSSLLDENVEEMDSEVEEKAEKKTGRRYWRNRVCMNICLKQCAASMIKVIFMCCLSLN
jgi:hypothetical protein